MYDGSYVTYTSIYIHDIFDVAACNTCGIFPHRRTKVCGVGAGKTYTHTTYIYDVVVGKHLRPTPTSNYDVGGAKPAHVRYVGVCGNMCWFYLYHTSVWCIW